MLFTDHCQQQVETERLKRLGQMFGTYWTRESVEQMFMKANTAPKTKPISEVMIPYVLWQVPNAADHLKNIFGASRGIAPPDWAEKYQDNTVEGFEMDPKDFLKLAGMFTGIIPKYNPPK